MGTATLNVRVSPRRMLSAREAAEYCGLPLKKFARECSVTPVTFPCGDRLFDMRDLDAWLDALKSGAGDDDEAILARLK